MEPMVFAIPASQRLVQATHQVVVRDPDMSLAEMRTTAKQAAMLYLDAVVDGFVHAILQQGQVSTLTLALLTNLSLVIKTVCRAIIYQATASASRADVEAIAEFFRARVMTTVRDGQKLGLLTYPLAPSQQELLQAAIRAGIEGRATLERSLYMKAMHEVVDRAVHYHFETPFGMLKLGFFTRGAVELGQRAILTAGHTAVKRSIPQDREEQLVQLSRFLESCVIPSSMIRAA